MALSHSDHPSDVFLVEKVIHFVQKFLAFFKLFVLLQYVELLRPQVVYLDSSSFGYSHLKSLGHVQFQVFLHQLEPLIVHLKWL